MPPLKRNFWKTPYQYLSMGKLRHDRIQISFCNDSGLWGGKSAESQRYHSPFSESGEPWDAGCCGKRAFLECFKQHFVWWPRDLIYSVPWCPEHLHLLWFYWDLLQKGSGEPPVPGGVQSSHCTSQALPAPSPSQNHKSQITDNHRITE